MDGHLRHSGSKGRASQWLRSHRFIASLALCFTITTLSILVVGFSAKNETGVNVIWIANGVLLTYLLLAPRRRWAAYLAVGFIALTIGSTLIGERWQVSLRYDLLDIVEVLTSALLLRWRTNRLPRFTDGRYLIRFLAYGILAGPLVAGLLLTAISTVLWHQPPWPTLLAWLTADSLGIAVATPIFTAIFRTRWRDSVDWRRNWIWPVLLVVCTLLVFGVGRHPFLFLIYPLLVLVLLRLGLGWAAAATLFVALAGAWFTLHSSGPLSTSALVTSERPVLLQIFDAVAMAMLYSISVLLEARRAMARKLEKIVALHTLVTENSRDIILLADFDGLPRYISPAVYTLTGWKPEETMDRSLADVVHAEDLPRIQALIERLREGGEAASIEYRLRNRAGGYVWVDGSFRMVSDRASGVQPGILVIVRDITERKQAEKRLHIAYDAVEALAVTDPLTGLANRRRFDQCLAAEWRRGLRDRKSLSLLMIDADRFKAFNDTYGHPRGDFCLKQIAEAAADIASRPGDLVARIGGEEFAILLPNTTEEGAQQVAQEICEALRGRNLEHAGNAPGIVTVSVGCATLTASPGMNAQRLIELADEALYRAKRAGRNQVCLGNPS